MKNFYHMNVSQRYTSSANSLHWLMAALLTGLFVVDIYMHALPLSPWKLPIYLWHKWVGVTVFLLVPARLAWRFTYRPQRSDTLADGAFLTKPADYAPEEGAWSDFGVVANEIQIKLRFLASFLLPTMPS